jgi:hypothetical protein
MKTAAFFLALLASVAATAAEPAHPHADQIRALDPDQVAGLLDGAGLGLARAAELNGYPGPLHVLELAAQLELCDGQLEATRAIRMRVVEAARALGARLVAAEAELEGLFRGGAASSADIDAALDRIAALQARLRGVHLKAHVEQRALLSAGQVERYMRLRGHDDGHGGHASHH